MAVRSMPGERRVIADQPVRAPPAAARTAWGRDSRISRRRDSARVEAHRAQAGQQRGPFGGRADEGQQQGQDGERPAPVADRRRVHVLGAGLEGRVGVPGAFLGPDPDGGRRADGVPERAGVHAVAGQQQGGGAGRRGGQARAVHDEEVGAGDGGGAVADQDDADGDRAAVRQPDREGPPGAVRGGHGRRGQSGQGAGADRGQAVGREGAQGGVGRQPRVAAGLDAQQGHLVLAVRRSGLVGDGDGGHRAHPGDRAGPGGAAAGSGALGVRAGVRADGEHGPPGPGPRPPPRAPSRRTPPWSARSAGPAAGARRRPGCGPRGPAAEVPTAPRSRPAGPDNRRSSSGWRRSSSSSGDHADQDRGEGHQLVAGGAAPA